MSNISSSILSDAGKLAGDFRSGAKRSRGRKASPYAGEWQFESSVVRVGRKDVRVGCRRAQAAPAGPPLLMFNGIGANLELLAPLARAVHGRDVLAFNVPGVVQSPLPSWPYRLGGLAQLVVAVLDHFCLSLVDVFEVSWGGVAPQEFVHRFPHRTRRPILAATSPETLMVTALAPMNPAAFGRVGSCVAHARLRGAPRTVRRPGHLRTRVVSHHG